VLRAVERDLRRKYGEKYRVVRADSGDTALQVLEQLQLRNDPLALMLVDQRMPRMSGVEFMERAVPLQPEAKKILLTAYADTDAAIRAINQVKIDHYLLKPWDPPEERLYPVIDDLLDDWQAAFRPPYEGIRMIGNRWSAKSHALRDFLARNQVPYQWLDVETSDEARRLVEQVEGAAGHLPLVLFPDGTSLVEPTTAQIAEKIGMRTRAEKEFYDLIIVGAGPAGLAAGVYGASEGLKTAMIEREAPGGQAGTSSRIENYFGFQSGVSGGELARRGVAQATRFGVEILTPQEATGVRVDGPYRYVTLSDGSELSCHALLIATGVSYRKLDVPGVEKLAGAGVYYGAAQTEALSCKDEDVYIVGGANSAGQAAMHFSTVARSVTMLVRGDSLEKGMSQYLVDEIRERPNISVCLGSQVVEVHGDDHLETITSQTADGNRQTAPAASLFIFIGAAPRTDWLDGVVERDRQGFILAGSELIQDGKRPKGWTEDRDPYLLETSVPGIFVAGDVMRGSIKRVAAGVGAGSIAVQFVHQYLAKVG
jgi:thioredoxin reductase (NADPH)